MNKTPKDCAETENLHELSPEEMLATRGGLSNTTDLSLNGAIAGYGASYLTLYARLEGVGDAL